MKAVDVVVIGGGVMGAATAHALARRDHSVALVEQFHVGHRRGSSHGPSRIFRLSYRDPMYVEMAQQALGLWRDLEDEVGEQLLIRTGGYDAGEGIKDNAAALEQCGADYRWIDGNEVSRLHAYLRFPPGAEVLFQPDAGIVRADLALSAFARGAAARGADVAEGERVRAVEPNDDRMRVHSDEVAFEARCVVVTAGSWAPKILAPLGIPLDVRPTRETVGYFTTDLDLTPTVVEWGSPSLYALPSPGQSVKAGEHVAGATTDPDDEGAPDASSLQRVSEWIQQRFGASVSSKAHFAETCIYTNTTDEHFVLTRHDRVVVGSPCSGHGFKFAPLIGRRLAELAAEVL